MPSTIVCRGFPLLLVFAAAACGGSAASPDSHDGGLHDGSTPTPDGSTQDGPAPVPDGGGVCCPIVSDPCGACGGPSGGWAASASQCGDNGACDGWIGKGVDAHGCPVIATGPNAPGAVCCGCGQTSDGGHDAQGDEGGKDSGGQGDSGDSCPANPMTASSCTGGLSCSYCDGGALCDCNLGQWECGGATSCLFGDGG